MQTLTPVLAVEGRDYLAVTPQRAGIAAKELGPAIADLSQSRKAILGAVDLLFIGFSLGFTARTAVRVSP